MVPELARQSIILKSRRDDNTILGNYECAYAMGLLSKLSGIALPEDTSDLKAVYEAFVPKLANYSPDDAQAAQVLRILRAYEPEEENTAQMQELLQMGLRENRVWQL